MIKFKVQGVEFSSERGSNIDVYFQEEEVESGSMIYLYLDSTHILLTCTEDVFEYYEQNRIIESIEGSIYAQVYSGNLVVDLDPIVHNIVSAVQYEKKARHHWKQSRKK